MLSLSASAMLSNTCAVNTCADLKTMYKSSGCCGASTPTFLNKEHTWDDIQPGGTLIRGQEITTVGYQARFNETTQKIDMVFTTEANDPPCYHQMKYHLLQNPGCGFWVGYEYGRALNDYVSANTKIMVPDLAEEELKPYTCDGDYEEDGFLKNPTIGAATTCTTTVKLRRDVRWSDGHPITAHDYTYLDEVHNRLRESHPSVIARNTREFTITAVDDYTLTFTTQNRRRNMFMEFIDRPFPRHFWSQYDSDPDTLFADTVPFPPETSHVEYDAEKTIWPDKSKYFERLVFKVNRQSPAYREKHWKVCWDTLKMTVEDAGVVHQLGGGCPDAKSVLEGPHVDYVSKYPIDDYRTGIPYFNANFFHTFSNAFFRQGIAPDNHPWDPSDATNAWSRNWAYNQDIKNKVIKGEFSVSSPTMNAMTNTLQYNLHMWPTKSLAFRQAITCLVDKRKYGMTRQNGHQDSWPVFGTLPDVRANEVPTYAERLCYDKNEYERQVLAIELLKQDGWTADDWHVDTALEPTDISSPGETPIPASFGIGGTRGRWGITPPEGLKAPDGTPVSEFADELYSWTTQPATVPYAQTLVELFNQLGVPTKLKRVGDLQNLNLFRYGGMCGNYSTWRPEWKDKFAHLPKWSGVVALLSPGGLRAYFTNETWAFGARRQYENNCKLLPTLGDWDGYGTNTSFSGYRAYNAGWSDPEVDRLNDFIRLYENARGGKTEEFNEKVKRLREIMNEHQLTTLLDAAPNAGTMYRNLVLPDDEWKNEMGPLSDRFVKITNANGKAFHGDKPDVVPLTLEPVDYGVEAEPTIVSPPPASPPQATQAQCIFYRVGEPTEDGSPAALLATDNFGGTTGLQDGEILTAEQQATLAENLANSPYAQWYSTLDSLLPSGVLVKIDTCSHNETSSSLFVSELGGNRKVGNGVYDVTVGGNTFQITFDGAKASFVWTDGNVYEWPYVESGECAGTYSWSSMCNPDFTMTFPVAQCTSTTEYTSGCATFGTSSVESMTLAS